MVRSSLAHCAAALLLLASSPPLRAQFNLQFTINPTGFTTAQFTVLEASLADAEVLWESVVTGYQPGISRTGISITVEAGSSFADAQLTGATNQGGYQLTTSGRVRINPGVIDAFGSWNGTPGPINPNPDFLELNYVDEILAHEIGHVLGLGTQWLSNGVYVQGSGQYTGQFGVAAYQAEFDPNATFVPVELAGSAGAQNTHWDQIIRSSTQEGNPSDPWSLDPRTGVTDSLGRDRALELMTGALDPDYGEPFLSLTTIQSLRDLGFAVVPEPTSISMSFGLVAVVLLLMRPKRRVGFSYRNSNINTPNQTTCWGRFSPGAASVVTPMRYSSIARAAPRPSLIAQTTRL